MIACASQAMFVSFFLVVDTASIVSKILRTRTMLNAERWRGISSAGDVILSFNAPQVLAMCNWTLMTTYSVAKSTSSTPL